MIVIASLRSWSQTCLAFLSSPFMHLFCHRQGRLKVIVVKWFGLQMHEEWGKWNVMGPPINRFSNASPEQWLSNDLKYRYSGPWLFLSKGKNLSFKKIWSKLIRRGYNHYLQGCNLLIGMKGVISPKSLLIFAALPFLHEHDVISLALETVSPSLLGLAQQHSRL